MAEAQNAAFDEAAREALALLLDNYWIFREEQPEQYQLVRQYETLLRNYFFEKCGWRLLQHPQFYKLEKIPARPESWMGIVDFQHPRDYALLCTVMAFLEEKSVDEQFLLSELCESILALYPHEAESVENLNWENYDHRRSLVRGLKYAVDTGLVRLVDGDGEQFAMRRDSEALYEVTLMSRYFLRSYPKDLHQYSGMHDLQSSEHFDEEALTGTGRRVRVYRHLLLTPSYNAAEARAEDFLYLRTMNKRLAEELESHIGLQLELYKDCAMLISTERNSWCKQIFPLPQNGLHAVMLHFARFCRDERCVSPDWQDILTLFELEKLVERCRKLYGSGWTKEYREMGPSKLVITLLQELISWKMADSDPETKLIELRPPFWRLIGRYPENYQVQGLGKES
ncbi:MAG TPA: TIGR02678 family protein [Firmicutes bacterium]|jgi:uncharacterized protein (TIGR02678 family)|nr:TIGR02678 family protein [Bacillota bacterium]